MFYKQCHNCGERWELGTTNICSCVTNASATISVDKFSHLGERTWVGLTDQERNKLWRDVVKWGDPSHDDVDLMKAIEAKLKEKNVQR